MNYFLPKKNELEQYDLDKWFDNIKLELTEDYLSSTEKKFLERYYVDAGLLIPFRKKFFSHHYSKTISFAVNKIFSKNKHPKILDLGAGTGSQSLLYSILGAEVTALDMDPLSLEILKKRKSFYEKHIGRELKITVEEANIFDFDFKSNNNFDAIYSLFAFNMMQPSKNLIPILDDILNKDGQMIIQDGNRENWFNRTFRKRHILSKDELQTKVSQLGFSKYMSIGAYSLPPFFWLILPTKPLVALDKKISSISSLMPVSYLHVFEK